MQYLDSIFHALSDSTRRNMVERLTAGSMTVSQLAEPFEISLPAVTKHINVLVDARLVVKERAGKNIYCKLDPGRLLSGEKWMEKQRDYWEKQLDSFAEFVSAEESKAQKVASSSRKKVQKNKFNQRKKRK